MPIPVPRQKNRDRPPALFPEDHSFSTCKPPTISGNPSNTHSVTFGDPRVPGSYSNRTTYRDNYRGPRPERLLKDTPLLEVFRTPEERRAAYDRATLRVGSERVMPRSFLPAPTLRVLLPVRSWAGQIPRMARGSKGFPLVLARERRWGAGGFEEGVGTNFVSCSLAWAPAAPS